VHENHRVCVFRELLRAANKTARKEKGGEGGGDEGQDEGSDGDEGDSEEEQTLTMLGELMYQSHASYSR
jgi:L-arabinokinase